MPPRIVKKKSQKTRIKPAADRIEAIAAMKVCPHSPFPEPPIVEHTLVVRINFSKIFKLCTVCLPVSNFSLLVLSTVESHARAPSAQRPPNVAHHASPGAFCLNSAKGYLLTAYIHVATGRTLDEMMK